MFRYFIAAKTFQYQLDCFCPGEVEDDVVTIKKGDIIELTNGRKYTMHNGWYCLIRIHKPGHIFYIALEDLEDFYTKERVYSFLDIDLKVNYLKYKINDALDKIDEGSFINYSMKLKEMSFLKDCLEKYLSNVPV